MLLKGKRRKITWFLSLQQAPYLLSILWVSLCVSCTHETFLQSVGAFDLKEDDYVLRHRDRKARKHCHNFQGAPLSGISNLNLPSLASPPTWIRASFYGPSPIKRIQLYQLSSKSLSWLCYVLTILFQILKSNPSFSLLRAGSNTWFPWSFPQSTTAELITLWVSPW